MTLHLTASGSVKLIASVRGNNRLGVSYRRPATIFTDSDDTRQAWSYTGSQIDALKTLAALERLYGQFVAMRHGNSYSVETAPKDFWVASEVDEDGEVLAVKPNLEKYPNVLAW